MTQQPPSKLPLAMLVSGERHAKNDSNATQSAAVAAFADPDALQGERGTFTPREGGPNLPPVNQYVAKFVEPTVREVAESWATYMNMLTSVGWGNRSPAACVDVRDPENPDIVLFEQVPPVVIIQMEAHLVKLRLFLEKIPTLPPTERWVTQDADGVWQSEPIRTRETATVQDFVVGYEATEHHPAQVQFFPRQQDLGEWESVQFSSAMQPARVREMLKRLDALVDEVRKAVIRANAVEVDVHDAGTVLMKYIFQ